MTYLIRAASHDNGITVIDDKEKNIIAKTSCDPHGIECLKQEYEGLQWYAVHIKQPIDALIDYHHDSETHVRINLKKFAGAQTSYKKPFLKNLSHVERAIDHYIKTWPNEAQTPVHGDLTLDNVIFTQSGVRFFDWEHFTVNPHPWGFDALYMLLSALLLPLKPDQLPTKQDYSKFMELLFLLFDKGLSSDLAEYPLSTYREIFKTRACWQGIVKRSPHKLFPLKYDELYIDIIDDQITRRIRHKRYDDYKKSVLIEQGA